MVSDKELITALRCSSDVPPYETSCTKCPYHITEELDGFSITACDVDQIGRDAADRLEELTRNPSVGAAATSPCRGGNEEEDWNVLSKIPPSTLIGKG